MAFETESGERPGVGVPQPLHPSDVLRVWEEAREQTMVARTLTILGRALPHVDRETLSDLPIGHRDALLLQLRERTFGPVVDCVTRCAVCDATIEFTMPVRDLLVERTSHAEGVVEWEGVRLRVRPATSRDLMGLTGLTDPAAMSDVLLQRCAAVIEEAPREEAPYERAPHEPRSVPPASADAVAAEMARLDPGADLRLELSCPACAANWASVFDAGSYVWREIDAAARRLLVEVHALARAYGWSESEILDLSSTRRRAYLELSGMI